MKNILLATMLGLSVVTSAVSAYSLNGEKIEASAKENLQSKKGWESVTEYKNKNYYFKSDFKDENKLTVKVPIITDKYMKKEKVSLAQKNLDNAVNKYVKTFITGFSGTQISSVKGLKSSKFYEVKVEPIVSDSKFNTFKISAYNINEYLPDLISYSEYEYVNLSSSTGKRLLTPTKYLVSDVSTVNFLRDFNLAFIENNSKSVPEEVAMQYTYEIENATYGELSDSIKYFWYINKKGEFIIETQEKYDVGSKIIKMTLPKSSLK